MADEIAGGRLAQAIPSNRLFRRSARGGVLLAEFVDAAGRIDDLLLTGVERVAVRAHLDLQIVSEGRAGLERVAARAADRNLFVFGMALGFHGGSPALQWMPTRYVAAPGSK